MGTVPLSTDRWTPAKAGPRAADPRVADLVDADPTLDADSVPDGLPGELWDALVFDVVGRQLSVTAARSFAARLEALQDGPLPTPA